MTYKMKFTAPEKFLKEVKRDMEAKIERALQESLSYLMAVGEPIVPIDTGVLRESAYITRLDWNKYNFGYFAVNPKSGFVYSYYQEEKQKYLMEILDIYSDNALQVFINEVNK